MYCDRECETYLQGNNQFSYQPSLKTHCKSVPESPPQPHLHIHTSLPDNPKVFLNRRSRTVPEMNNVREWPAASIPAFQFRNVL